jgi:DnaJ-class molecular chaperone
MKKIDDYRTLLQVQKQSDLQELKKAYRSVMKEWHPDKFHANPDAQLEAEAKSKKVIEAYHFLVSIAPETHEQNLDNYNETINNATILDYQHKGVTLTINFSDGNSYEYFDVPKTIFIKFHNAETQSRFARRHICTNYVYRIMSKLVSENA